jgi:murein DD-endopeptidase MepM/ murein hydrolase activator NlpD
MFAIGIVPVTEIANAGAAWKPPACPGATYSVVGGDSWSKIASRTHITMSALLNANKATTATVIHPGQTLCLTSTSGVAESTATTTTAPTAAATTIVTGPTVSIDVFPVQGPCSFGDSYLAPRSGGRSHEGVDIIAKSGQWVYAAKDGTLTKKYLDSPGSLSGNGWRLTAADGSYFFYAHLSTFAAGLSVGSPVKAGQILGQVGKTGDASTPHLHFEVHPGGGPSVNPTPVVKAVDGCKTSTVPPQPGGMPGVVTPTTVLPSGAVPATPVPATTVPPVTTAPAPTTTVPAYVPPAVPRRDGDTDTDAVPRPRR